MLRPARRVDRAGQVTLRAESSLHTPHAWRSRAWSTSASWSKTSRPQLRSSGGSGSWRRGRRWSKGLAGARRRPRWRPSGGLDVSRRRTATDGSSWRSSTPPVAQGSDQDAPANTPGLPHVAFAAEGIEEVIARLQARGAELVGELERYQDSYWLCDVRGPEGIIVEFTERIG